MITGLHHVTATVGDARDDVAFHSGALGLRLLKRTINFDNPAVYHLYYGNEIGDPSTIMTTFPYGGWGMRPGRAGTGQITETWYSVPPGSLGGWKARLAEWAASVEAGRERVREGVREQVLEGAMEFGEPSLRFADPSGLAVRLVEAAGDARPPWISGGVPASEAIRGVHHITIRVRRPEPSVEFLTRMLGFEVVGEEGGRTRVAVPGAGAGAIVEVEGVPGGVAGAGGIGTVHHVAFAVAGDEEQGAFQERLRSAGWPVTDVRDRQYFRSIYFPEPGGALFEIATAGPGFAVDEPVAGLGSSLKLPPWEEPNRASIEPNLPVLETA